MIRMNIKTRILAFVVFFELFAYSSIQLFNNYIYKQELLLLKSKELHQTFAASTTRINYLSLLMERNVTDLAIAGERFFSLVQNDLLTIQTLEKEAEQLLVTNFASFPEAIGGGLWYEPYSLSPSLKYFGPYAFQGKNNVEFSWDLNTPEYDYPNQDWYTIASRSGWGREQSRVRPIFWTAPYYDDAGTFSLMMTVDAIMLDEQGSEIGMATVDWSLEKLTNFLDSVKITDNSHPFLIHRASGKFISYPKQPEYIMQAATRVSWGNKVIEDVELDRLKVLTQIQIDQQAFNIYFYHTQSGFIFGSLSPMSDQENEIATITRVTLLAGAGIGAVFILLMFIVMTWLFSPFDYVLKLIKESISHKDDVNSTTEVEQIKYDKSNEFTPIIEELNKVYGQVSQYMSDISRNNQDLFESKNQIKRLNEKLEEKVELRTRQLAAKTQEALNSVQELKRTQKHLIEQEKHASLGRLVTGLAHEINTPLGICITSASHIDSIITDLHQRFEAETLQKKHFLFCYQELHNSSEILEKNLRRTSELVANFKQVSADQNVDTQRQFMLCDYLDKIIQSLRPKLSKSTHRLIFTPIEPDIEIYSNPGVLTQVMTNLVDNALLHAFHGIHSGQIIISASLVGKTVCIRVKDNGNGMSADTQAQIFDPFFTTARHIGGTGLGMHIVYNLVTQQLHGEIECQTQLNRGTEFVLTFPQTGAAHRRQH